jgi:hypothetical protein
MTPDQQIAVRDRASKADARAQASARRAAATRALAGLDVELAGLHRELPAEPATAPAPAATATAIVTTPAAPPAAEPATPATTTPTPTVATATAPTDATVTATSTEPPTPTASDSTTEPTTEPTTDPASEPTAAADASEVDMAAALLEVKPPTLTTDPAHIGERLVIFGDRVELHDRSDKVRQVINGDDIIDVVVHKRFTGATVTVESIDGSSIVAKGLNPDKAERVREIIQRRTRQTKPANPDRARPAVAAAPTIDADDLIDKLKALHAAGVLTDAELAQKTAAVQQLAAGHPLAASNR